MFMKEFRVPVEYCFKGYYKISAHSREDALRIADRDCGISLGGVHTSNDECVLDWEFDMTPIVLFTK